MTIKEEIIAAVAADPSLQALADIGNDTELAASITLTRPIQMRLTTAETLDALGLVDGADLMATLRKRALIDTQLGRQAAEIVRMMD